MGVILDSSVVIAAERRKTTVSALTRHITERIGDQDAALSAVGFTELVHALHRASDSAIRERHRAFLAEIAAGFLVLPYTRETAYLAGRVDGQERARGFVIPIIDLMIGATALEQGYAVVTVNLRHFRMIPGLNVIAL
jgi:predicted nucleic acid-binding protein